MQLPVMPPIEPMLANSAATIPRGMHYEPKWDGFRCIIFRDGAEVVLGSRGSKELQRYFPEIVAGIADELPERCVVDGELVVPVDDHLKFDALSERIHPAQSRIELLAAETPARFIAFDLLADGNKALLDTPYQERRARLTEAVHSVDWVHLTPVTTDYAQAERWFEVFEGAGLDGLICKPAGLRYQPGKRAMTKIKHVRTADVVLAGFRWHKGSSPGTAVGSLLLGLYDDAGVLHHVGVAGAFTAQRRAQLVEELAPLRRDAAVEHPWFDAETGARRPGAESRWNKGKDMDWEPLRIEKVVEVRFQHLEGDRFRHNAQFVRWRPDRSPDSCTYAQLDSPVRYDLTQVLRGSLKLSTA